MDQKVRFVQQLKQWQKYDTPIDAAMIMRWGRDNDHIIEAKDFGKEGKVLVRFDSVKGRFEEAFAWAERYLNNRILLCRKEISACRAMLTEQEFQDLCLGGKDISQVSMQQTERKQPQEGQKPQVPTQTPVKATATGTQETGTNVVTETKPVVAQTKPTPGYDKFLKKEAAKEQANQSYADLANEAFKGLSQEKLFLRR